MRNILYILLGFLAGIMVVKAQQEIDPNGYNVFLHPNGKKSSEGSMRDGKPDGYWKTYNEDGVLISEGNRKNFLLDSTWYFYDDEGKIKMVINYKQGLKDGIRKTIREDETVEETFSKDIKNGATRWFYPAGKLKKQVNFTDGLEEGRAFEYAEDDGRIITLITYKSGFIVEREMVNRYDNNGQKHGKWKYFYDNGILRKEGVYNHGFENGYFKEYDISGNLMTTSKFTDGTLQEDVAELAKLEVRKDYYPDGSVKIAATYNKEGKMEGIRREYAPDGNIERSFIFKNGIMIGEGVVTEKGERDGFWKEYYDSGQLRAEGNYDKDNKTGRWKFYFLNGETEQEGVYRNGKPDGPWRWYYDTGALLREEYYFNGLLDGEMVEYNENGDIITKGSYIEGKEEGGWTFRTGKTLVEGSYAGGMRNGEWKYWDVGPMGEKNILRFEGRFIEDNPQGKHVYYWENGKRKDEGEYVMGRKNGDWIHYYSDGTPFLVVTYKDGREVKYDGIRLTDLGIETPEE